MPTIKIDTNFEEPQCVAGLPPYIRLPEGLVMIEIQGTIHRPEVVPDNYNYEKCTDFIISKHEGQPAVRIGRLKYNLESPNNSKVELLIGKNQKLIGKVIKLEKPLGILRFPKMNRAQSVDQQHLAGQAVKVVDIIRHKLVFSQRPVPLMDG